ncbi:MAG: LamG-like jellyroll fold domain-containing protein, partial [Thermoguttaceae bacterium]
MFRFFRKHQGLKSEASSRGKRKSSFASRNRESRLKFETLESRWLLDGTMLLISEFMAENTKTLADGNGKYPDWIEIYNPNTNAVDLAGWHMTDNANKTTKWPLPSITLQAGGYLVVFASGESTVNYVDSLGYYHTNFKIDKEGEYLGLYRPDGTVACEYSPTFPQQVADVSYGVDTTVTSTSLVAAGASAKVLVPTTSNGGSTLGSTWEGASTTFDDSSWTSGTTGVGYTGTLSAVESSYLKLRLNADSYSAIVTDTSGAGHNGTNVGSNVSWVSSSTDTTVNPLLRHGVMQFDATKNDQVTVDVNSDFNGSTSGTVSFWMKSSGTSGTGSEGAVLFDLRSSRGLSILQTDAGKICVHAYQQGNSTAVNTITSSASISDNQWHLVTVSFTQTLGGTCAIYIDGVPDSQGTNTAAWNFTQTQGIAIGQSLSAYTKNWRKYNGSLDDLRFYSNYVLTSTEIANIYNGTDEAVDSSDVSLNVLSQMKAVNSSVFIRIPFTVTDINAYTSLKFTIRYNDGFVAWINGVQVAAVNSPTTLAWNSAATAISSPGREQVITITVTSGMLRAGTNILAIQGLNNAVSDANFLIMPQLDGINIANVKMYLATATPGAVNSAGKTDLGPFITDVTNSVERPAGGSSSQPLTITAHVAQTIHSVSTVQLAYRIMFGSETLVTMYDDGPSGGHGDAVAGDLTFTALIPTTSLIAGQ